jgi:hypothetical protein
MDVDTLLKVKAGDKHSRIQFDGPSDVVRWPARSNETPSSVEPFWLQSNFFDKAEVLRSDFEKAVASIDSEAGIASLAYLYSANAYQCLGGWPSEIFNRDVLSEFLQQLSTWAGQRLRASRVSAPRLRVYIKGCSRVIARDDAKAKWHYILSLTRNSRNRLAEVKLLADAAEVEEGGTLIGNLSTVKVRFNDLLVHDLRSAYGISDAMGSMNPSDCTIFLDGYIS